MLEPRFSLEFGYAQVEFDGFPLPRFQACFSESSRDAKKLRGWDPALPSRHREERRCEWLARSTRGTCEGTFRDTKGPFQPATKGTTEDVPVQVYHLL